MRRIVSLAAVIGLASGALVATPLASASAEDGVRGTITWVDCPEQDFDGFECGILTVPLDWDDLDNPANAEVALAVHRATSQNRIGALTFNPGGPGEEALSIASAILDELPAQVRNRFDFVAWDPRGIGRTMPQLEGCNLDPDPSYVPPLVGPVDWDAFAQSLYDVQAEKNVQCLEANTDVAPYLGTYYVIRDLDAMRAALGEEQWNFWGMSYGSRIGYRYAREFPDRLRTLVLDGSWSPNLTISSWMNGATWNYPTAQAVWARLFGKKMAYRLQRVIDGLEETPFVADGQLYSRWDMVGAFWANISYQRQYDSLTSFITYAYKALYAPTAAKRRAAAAKAAEPLRVLTQDAESATMNINFINCRDLGDYPSPARIGRTASVSAQTGSVASAQIAVSKGISCAGLPADYTKGFTPLTTSLKLPIAPVVINSLGDTRTEYDFGRTMANFLWDSSLITYEGTQHVTYLQTPAACVNDPVTQYFLRQTAPGDRTCGYVATPSS